MIRSYLYYMYFHNNRLKELNALQMTDPGALQQQVQALPVPRLQAVPQVQAPASVTREPYHNLPAREVESDIAQQLNADLQAGTHPTTQALVPLGLRFVKILGAGSQGTAVLFEMDDANGVTRKIVAKYENKDQGTGDSGSGDTSSGDTSSGDTSSGYTSSGVASSGGAGSGSTESDDGLDEEKRWMNVSEIPERPHIARPASIYLLRRWCARSRGFQVDSDCLFPDDDWCKTYSAAPVHSWFRRRRL